MPFRFERVTQRGKAGLRNADSRGRLAQLVIRSMFRRVALNSGIRSPVVFAKVFAWSQGSRGAAKSTAVTRPMFGTD